MNRSASLSHAESANPVLDELVAEITDRLQAGETVDMDAYAARHPDLADELRRLLPALQVLAVAASESGNQETAGERQPDACLSGALGDFRIVRELGRGGMGVVYEAEQISLGRRVALKVLPLASTLDPRHLQRFKNEAQAAAHLQHQNIVPVYFVGCDRGVHYYAMQLIDGHSVAQVIDQLRAERGGRTPEPGASTADLPERQAEVDPNAALLAVTQAAATEPAAHTATTSDTPASGLSRPAYFAWVARLGEQAALALEHAHQLGVLHRDIKPANLMLDGRGNLWITDFGLAHLPGDQRLTMTGDLLGTLRYMSPEQALAQRVVIDQRTDVYSLGVTLYELLTLEPAYGGKDRHELLRQIAFEEPRAPRRRDRAIPVELETIVLKGMAKAPNERYATAQELADDLRHWLEDRPIKARRPALWQRLRRWSRRHRPLAAGTIAASLAGLLVAAVGLGWAAHDRATRRALAAGVIAEALSESAEWQRKGKLPEAISAARRAKGLLTGAAIEPALAPQVDERLADLDLLDSLQRIRLEQGTTPRGLGLDKEAEDAAYAQAFRSAGLDPEALPTELAAARMRATSVAVELASVLDQWASVRHARFGERDPSWKRLLQVACLVDPDDWRARARQAVMAGDRLALQRLADSADVATLSPFTLEAMASAMLSDKGSASATVRFLRAAQQRHPGDFWLNWSLGALYRMTRPPEPTEAMAFSRAALAVRPNDVAAHNNLGVALNDKGQHDEAIAELREAIRLKKDYVAAHINLGNALADKGQLDEAIAEYREAIRLKKDDADAHDNLGRALIGKGQLDEAIAEYREAIRLKKDDADAHINLGVALNHKGQHDEAIAEYREAIRLKKDYAEAHTNLGVALREKGQVDEAIAEYREAIRLKKDDALPHNNLGVALIGKGQLDEAIAEYREAIRLKKDDAEAHNNLGNALAGKGQLDEAIAEFREAIRLKKDYAFPHNNLGLILAGKGQLDEAIAEYREAIRLKKDYAEAHNNLGVALDEKGQLDEAIAEFREAIRLRKELAQPHHGLGLRLADKGQLDEAIAELREAIRLKKDDAQAHHDLANILLRERRLDEAVAECREAIRLDCAEAHCTLAQALSLQGYFRLAADEFRRGHTLGIRKPRWPYPSAERLREEEIRARLEDHLNEYATGKIKPSDAEECIQLALVCCSTHHRLTAMAARLYTDAFAAKPTLVEQQLVAVDPRYDAACSACLAGCSIGKDVDKLTAADRAGLRRQGLAWLQADLKAYKQALDGAANGLTPREIAGRLQNWLRDDDLAGIRDPKALAALPAAEREQWRKLWQEAQALRRRALKTPAPGSAGGPARAEDPHKKQGGQ